MRKGVFDSSWKRTVKCGEVDKSCEGREIDDEFLPFVFNDARFCKNLSFF